MLYILIMNRKSYYEKDLSSYVLSSWLLTILKDLLCNLLILLLLFWLQNIQESKRTVFELPFNKGLKNYLFFSFLCRQDKKLHIILRENIKFSVCLWIFYSCLSNFKYLPIVIPSSSMFLLFQILLSYFIVYPYRM